MSKKWFALGAIILILIVGSLIYSGNNPESSPEITTTTPTLTSSTTTSVPSSTLSNTLSDREMIEQLIFDYHVLLKSESLDKLVDLFVDDAKLTFTQFSTYHFSGKNQIRNYFGSRFEAVEGPSELEVVDTSIKLDGLKATVKIKAATGTRFATENFELIKIGGVWKISSLNIALQ